ncbi:hypothetical protein MMC25_004053 [Agyrium rufum]|nr:hypothetical protein [Agyrium rufum]
MGIFSSRKSKSKPSEPLNIPSIQYENNESNDYTQPFPSPGARTPRYGIFAGNYYDTSSNYNSNNHNNGNLAATNQRSLSYSNTLSAGKANRLPIRVLDAIFSAVCPHAADETYLTAEDSIFDDNGCMLCDMRDLAQCARVCRQWGIVAQSRLYHSVRLDPVHYCQRETVLSERRKRRSFFDRNGTPKDATEARLSLFANTVRSSPHLALLVQFLKMPYMTRETSKADLARTVSVLQHLKYVDLPDGFYREDQSSVTLRGELMARCPDIRKMRFWGGSEEGFTVFARGMGLWTNLEDLELSRLRVEPDVLLYVLASFPALQSLVLEDVASVDDAVFMAGEPRNPGLPAFPPVRNLELKDTPGVTAEGLTAYLPTSSARSTLKRLTLAGTGVALQNLHLILAAAPGLTHLTVSETISRSFPITPVPPLSSRSLQCLRFEILPESLNHAQSAEMYYSYVASSLLGSNLPSLKSLYAYSPSLPDLLLFPPTAHFGGASNGHRLTSTFQSPSRFSIYSTTSTYSSGPGTSSEAYNPFQKTILPPTPQSGTFLTPNPTSPQNLNPTTAGNGLISSLNLYTKSPSTPELEWSYTYIEPPSPSNGRRGSATATRPLSLVLNAPLHGKSSSFGGFGGPVSSGLRSPGGRETLVGNGFGGYLSVPIEGDEGSAGSGGGKRRSHGFGGALPSPAKVGDREDRWMG